MVIEITQGIVLILILLELIFLWRKADRLENTVERMREHENDIDTKLTCTAAAEKEILEQVCNLNDMIGALRGQVSGIPPALEEINRMENEILCQMDEIASAASLNDLVASGMNNLMNYDGTLRKGGE